ncbi:FG-GAP-like repeat-containing protein [Hymenobacter sp.]|uniref:T9SS type A sorting domain-containing protein n=1 Tax=Hymenobacter sp. TaxID=1898978 RepID=UPI00286C2A29|nr:FG-GAP-like repeat-containing protein [Hymenobacter sp.]
MKLSLRSSAWLGAAASVLLAFAAQAQPVVTGLAPAAAAAGATVVINGSGFSATAGRDAVNFGAVRATVTAATATQLTVQVPVGASSIAPVTVTDLVSRQVGSSLASATPFFTLRFAGPGLNAASYQATSYPVATPQLIGFAQRNLAAADFNADNYPDFAIVADGLLSLVFGDGQGGYGPPVQLAAGTTPANVQAVDVDANGAADLLVTAASGVFLLRSLGGGNGFASATPLNLNGQVPVGPFDVQDTNADGLPDLVAITATSTTQQFAPVQLVELRNNGAGFDAPVLLLTERLLGKVVADFNQDGRLDIALLSPDQLFTQPPCRVVLLARNAANTGYDAPVVSLLSNTTSFRSPLLADINVDGRPDVVVNALYDAVGATVVAERTAAGFALRGPFPSITTNGGDLQLAADADGDGLPDLLANTFSAAGGFTVLRGQAGGGLGQPIGYNVAGNTFVAGDFDLDGRTDLAAYDGATGNLVVYRYTGLGPNVNNPPTLNALADLTLDEDAPQQTVALGGISNGGDAGQAVTITAVSDDPGLIPNPTIAYFSPTSTGTLRFQPAPDAFGTCLISVTAADGQAQGGTVVRTFRVTVNPVNDAPTLDAIPDVIITTVQTSDFQVSVPLSGITSGAANENQVLSLSAISSVTQAGGGLPNGTFTYTSPAATGEYQLPLNIFGGLARLLATVTITVNDGQASNSTTSRTFRVYYNPGGTAPNQPASPPTLDPIADVTASRALTTQVPVALTGIADGDPNQVLPLTVTAISSDPSLVSLDAVSYGSPAATGAIPYAISSTRGGTATVSVTVSNGQAQNGTITRSFSVTVPAAPVVSGTRNPAGAGMVSLYPNPAPDGRFWVESSSPGEATVLDLSGRVVLKEQVPGRLPRQLQLSSAAKGLYLLRIRTAEGTTTRRLAVE